MSANKLTLILRLVTVLLVIGALIAAALFWRHQVRFPSTKDLYIEADILYIAPRVSGPLVAVHVQDNQPVKTGDLLFEIDPTDFQKAVEGAQADLASAQLQFRMLGEAITAAEDSVDARLATFENQQIMLQRSRELLDSGAGTQEEFDNVNASFRRAKADLDSAKRNLEQLKVQRGTEETNPSIQAARVALEEAQLQLSYTKVSAPVDGYITNLNLPVGTYVTEGDSQLVLLKAGTWRAAANFKETDLRRIQIGDKARVFLKMYPGRPFEGTVQGIGWGVASEDLPSTEIPIISPTVDWVRLAQRFPVRIQLGDMPPDYPLRVGASGYVQIHSE